MKKRLITLFALVCLVALLLPLTVSAATPQNGWHDWGDGTYSYFRNGEMVVDEVINTGRYYYGFDEYGIMYADEGFWCGDYYYRAKENGVLYQNEWVQPNADWGNYEWYYFGADAKAPRDFVQVGGKWYYFDGRGMMVTDQAVYSNQYQCSYALSKDGKSYVAMPKQGWYNAFGSYYYVDEYGDFLSGTTLSYNGKMYAFTWDGKMVSNGISYSSVYDYDTDRYFYALADANGVLYQNGWKKIDGIYYYVKNYEAYCSGKYQIDGVWYCFNSDGQLCTNGIYEYYDHDRDEWVYALASSNGALIQNGWYQIGSDWYYASNGEAIDYGVQQINGNWYYFNDYKMQANYVQEDIYIYQFGGYVDLVIPADGKIVQNGWAQANGNWYYLDEGEFYEYGAYNINGKYYYFDWSGILIQTPGEYNQYFITKDGTVLTNTWYEDKTGDEPGYNMGWRYYGSDGSCYSGEVYTIDGKVRYFNYNGIMQTNCVAQGSNGAYLFDANGVGTKKTGWFQEPSTKSWYYADGNNLARDEVKTINGYRYAFAYDGWMIANDYYYDYNTDAYYLFGSDGKGITATGWQKVDGAWYYVESGGKLARGWKQLNGKWYYLNPTMLHDCMRYDETEKVWYAYDGGGVASKLTGTGWKDVSWGHVYIENGKPVTGWKQIGSYWYYFYTDGEPYTNTRITINGYSYGFDAEGRMLTNTWYGYNSSYYFGSNGKGVTGLQTIDGKQYYFTESGELDYYSERYLTTNGVTYYIEDGVVQFKIVEGWFQVNGTWYYGVKDTYDYYEGDYYLERYWTEINNKNYLFSEDHRLLTNGLYEVWGDWFLTDASGVIKPGWNQYKGNWYYADGAYLYRGEHEINGYTYVFDGNTCAMKTGTFVYNDYVYVANSGGKVQSKTALPDGWTYDENYANYRYLKNGQPVTGWVGDYYVEDGVMLFSDFVEYNGACYYLDKDGRCVRNGWYKLPYGDWIYARANGTLYCCEWLQSGSTWYYFSGYRMAYSGTYEINGVLHRFDENGKWLGKYTAPASSSMPVKADGWQKINNKWYYYHAGKPVSGKKFINGSWYQFGLGYYEYEYYNAYSYSGAYMITNDCDINEEFYYGSDGKRATYTGWKQIGGRWYYFLNDHSMAYGLQKINGVWYYFENLYLYDKNDNRLAMSGAPAMAKSIAVVENNKLYIFDANGKCYNPTTKDGWYQVDGQWYYVVNGVAAQSEVVLYKGNYYYFDDWGTMATNDVCYCYNYGFDGPVYINANGIIVTTAGWYKVYNRWVYVQNGGTLCEDGIYKINGKNYSFYGYYLLE